MNSTHYQKILKNDKPDTPKDIPIWIGIFLYTIIAGLIIQLILLPYVFPGWSNGEGLIKGMDTVKFHRYSFELLNKIQKEGWQAWNIKPQGQTVVGIATLFYAWIGPHPWSVLPLNGILNATGGLAIFKILFSFVKDRKIAFWGTLPYLLFPTALSWTAQFHNDNYMVAGVSLFLLGWIEFSAGEVWLNKKKIVLAFLYIFVGIVLIWFVRDYVISILSVLSLVVGLVIVLILFINLAQKNIALNHLFFMIPVVCFTVSVCFIISTAYLVGNESKIRFDFVQFDNDSIILETKSPENELSNNKNYNWTKLIWLPGAIDNRIKALVITRVKSIDPKGESNIDVDVNFNSSIDFIKYLPRAFEIGFLAPFPYQWFEKGHNVPNTAMRKVTGLEMLFVYGSWLGIMYAIWMWRKKTGLWVLLIICVGMIVIYSVVVSNIGTLHRFRYGFIMPLVGLGVVGWFGLIKELPPKLPFLTKCKGSNEK